MKEDPGLTEVCGEAWLYADLTRTSQGRQHRNQSIHPGSSSSNRNDQHRQLSQKVTATTDSPRPGTETRGAPSQPPASP